LHSDGTGSFRVRLSEEPKGFDPEGGDEGVKVDLGNGPESLLDFLNAWRKVVRVHFG